VPDTTYRLITQGVLGWPDTFELLIKQGDALVFLGLADWELDRTLAIGCLSPIRAEQVRVLADHYREGQPCYDRFTNTEIAFLGDAESALLHQGQSATLGDCEIILDIARTIDHDYCPDKVIDLRLEANQVKDISGVARLTELRMVDLSSNQITHIAPLVENTGLGEGGHVYLAGNPLSGNTVEANLQQLLARGVQVDW
jgi:hypothetical protein